MSDADLQRVEGHLQRVEGHRTQMIQRAAQRRAVLVQAGYSTYRLGLDARGEPRGVTCLCCGLTSYNSHDIVQKFCGFCHSFHAEWTSRDAK